MAFTVVLEGGSPWGFRLEGGSDFNQTVRIAKINRNSKAYNQGVQVGDQVVKIGGRKVSQLMHNEALQLIRDANTQLVLELHRGGSLSAESGGTKDINQNSLHMNGIDQGSNKVKIYKPVSFDVPSSRTVRTRSSQSATQVAPLSPLHVTGSSQPVSSPQSFPVSPSGGKPAEDPMDSSEKGHQPSPLRRDSGMSSTSITLTSPHSPMSPADGSTAYSQFAPSMSPKKVVWSPGQKSPSLDSEMRTQEMERAQDRRQEEALKNMPVKWTPGGSSGGGDAARREFRPVKLDTSSALPQVRQSSHEPPPPGPEESFAWKPSDRTVTSPVTIATSTTTRVSSAASPTNSRFSAWNGTASHFTERKSSLPPSQSPTVTLLQKDRGTQEDFEIPSGIRTVRVNEDEIPKGAILIGKKETREEDKKHTDTYYLLPAEGATTTTRKVEVKKAPVYRDIGPTDEQTGMPVGLRSQIDTKKQKDWYKKMYSSLHRIDKRTERGSSDVVSGSEEGHRQESNAYKPTYVFPENLDEESQEAPNPYRPSYEFPSGGSHVNSRDSSTMSLDRYGRLKSPSPKREVKRSWSPPHAKYRTAVYKNQPRSIIEYEPGHSSIADRESKLRDPTSKENNSALYNPPIEKPGQYSRYVESDSELEYHRRERPLSPCSDVSPRDLYKKVHQGGDIPYTGFGYPAQDKKGDPAKIRPPTLHVPAPTLKSSTLTNNQHLSHVGSLSRKGAGFSSPTDRNNNALFKGRRSRSLSASEQLGVTSQLPPKRQPNCENANDENRDRDRGYATLQTPGRQAARSRFSDSDVRSFTLDRRRYNAEETRRRRDEEDARRQEKLQRIYAEEKRKKLGEEMRANEARRHNDYFTASQKSPIPKDRFEEVLDAASLERPKKKSVTKIRGKAKALYSFRAQNPRELSFRRADTLFLLRAIDRNWYEGEHHGRVGIFPVNYVEVTTSLDEARTAAHQREGNAIVKYNFKAQSPIELSLRVGDEVSVIRQLDDNWLEGRIGQRQGIFPFNYVDIINEPDTPLMTPQLTPRSSYACTPRTGSPGQLSPVSTMSNGPAPTIPSAPISPRMFDFDFDQQSNFSPRSIASSTQNSYQREYIPSPSPSLQQRTQRSYGLLQESMNRARSPQPINRARSPQPIVGKQQAPQRIQNNYGTYRAPETVMMNGSYSQKNSRLIASQSPERRVYGGFKEPEGRGDMYKDSGPITTQFVQEKSHVTEASPHSSRDGHARRYKEPIYPPFRSIYNYKPQNEDELELKDGDIVYVMEKCDDGWYVGTSDRTKEFGTFPGNYVKPI